MIRTFLIKKITYVNELFETNCSEKLPNVMTDRIFGDLFVLILSVLFPQMYGVNENRVAELFVNTLFLFLA